MVQQVFDSIAVKEIQGTTEISMDAGVKPTTSANTGLIIRNNSATGDGAAMSIIGGGTGTAQLNFGFSTDEDRSYIQYNLNTDVMRLATSTAERAALGATEVVFNDTSADTDFRIESNDNTHCIFLDAGNNRVGIMNSVPAEALHISGGNISITRTATTAPATPVSGTGTLFISGGDLNYIGPAGTLTRVAIG